MEASICGDMYGTRFLQEFILVSVVISARMDCREFHFSIIRCRLFVSVFRFLILHRSILPTHFFQWGLLHPLALRFPLSYVFAFF